MRQLFILLIFFCSTQAFSQAEFATWGNMTGIRVDDQLMEFNTSLAISDTEKVEQITRKEGQPTSFKREGALKIFEYEMNTIDWVKTISSVGEGEAKIAVSLKSSVDTLIGASFFRISLPVSYDSLTQFQISKSQQFSLKEIHGFSKEALLKVPGTGLIVKTEKNSLDIKLTKATQIMINKSKDGRIEIDFLMSSGIMEANQVFENQFLIKASGEIDRSTVEFTVYPEQLGKAFDGVGGNFRLQNPSTDPQVIDYSLENLRVSWSRVELPWSYWHADLEKDPVKEAKAGNLHPKVKDAMEMAQKMDRQGIPVILATWFAPEWAIIGKRAEGVNIDGSRGNALDQSKKEEIYASITQYIQYLKEEYGVKTVMFSFNESDLGIDVRQTPEEHNMLMKELGAYFRSKGIQTEFLLGDTADAEGWPFTTLASTDPETRQYIGGVSFHSWRGWTDKNLLKWFDISNRVNKPLFIGEGSIDAGAWRYPQILEEPTYALDEIDVYVKILAKAQPISILQWQLTADYSPMSGGGIFGNTEDDLHPTQRFFNLQQLGNTPKDSYSIPVVSEGKNINSAAFKTTNNQFFTLHIVNKGAAREGIVKGVPSSIKKLEVFVTNGEKSNKKVKTVNVKNGVASFNLEGASYITLLSK